MILRLQSRFEAFGPGLWDRLRRACQPCDSKGFWGLSFKGLSGGLGGSQIPFSSFREASRTCGSVLRGKLKTETEPFSNRRCVLEYTSMRCA